MIGDGFLKQFSLPLKVEISALQAGVRLLHCHEGELRAGHCLLQPPSHAPFAEIDAWHPLIRELAEGIGFHRDGAQNGLFRDRLVDVCGAETHEIRYFLGYPRSDGHRLRSDQCGRRTIHHKPVVEIRAGVALDIGLAGPHIAGIWAAIEIDQLIGERALLFFERGIEVIDGIFLIA